MVLLVQSFGGDDEDDQGCESRAGREGKGKTRRMDRPELPQGLHAGIDEKKDMARVWFEALRDRICQSFEQLEDEFADLRTPQSPTQRVAGTYSTLFTPVDHLERLLSLDNAFSRAEFDEFCQRVRRFLGLKEEPLALVAEPKIDGLSISLTYIDGRLQQGATRGDGAEGEDVTANLRTMAAVPTRLHGPAPARIEIRGEVFMTKADFLQLNEAQRAAGEFGQRLGGTVVHGAQARAPARIAVSAAVRSWSRPWSGPGQGRCPSALTNPVARTSSAAPSCTPGPA